MHGHRARFVLFNKRTCALIGFVTRVTFGCNSQVNHSLCERELALRELGVGVWRSPECGPGDPCMGASSLAMLADLGINDVLLEAGPTLLTAFWDAELIDAAFAFVGPDAAPDDQPGLLLDHPLVQAALATPAQPSGDDAMHHAVLQPAWAFPGATCG